MTTLDSPDVKDGAGALFVEPSMLFLVESLRAVDSATEPLLVASEWRGGVVLVNHRLTHLAAFDRVIVPDGGRIVEDDAPAALAEHPKSRCSELQRAARPRSSVSH